MVSAKTKSLMRVAAAIVTVSSIYIFAPWEFGLYYLKPTFQIL